MELLERFLLTVLFSKILYRVKFVIAAKLAVEIFTGTEFLTRNSIPVKISTASFAAILNGYNRYLESNLWTEKQIRFQNGSLHTVNQQNESSVEGDSSFAAKRTETAVRNAETDYAKKQEKRRRQQRRQEKDARTSVQANCYCTLFPS